MSSQVDLDFTFEFEDASGTVQTITVTGSNKQAAYQQARRKAISKNIAKDKQDFEKTFNLSRTSVEYADPPWSSANELEKELNSLQGVSTVRYSDPYSGNYGPPTYYLTISPNASKRTVKQAVNNYFSGFVVDDEQNKIAVKLKPTS
jgi:ribosomal protein L23